MAPQLLHRSTLSIAFIAALQYVLPGLLIALALVGLTHLQDWPFDSFLTGLAWLSLLLSALVLRPLSGPTPDLRLDAMRLISSVFARWMAIAVALMAIGYISGLSEHFPRRIILPWAILSPCIAAITLVILHVLLCRITMAKENQRSAIMVGVNESSLALANKLTKHPEFHSTVLGFFDDRATERLGAMGDFRMLGKLNELPAFVQEQKVEVIFVALPIRHVDRVMKLLDDLRDSTVSIYYVPDVFVFELIQSRTSEIEGIPVVALCETPFFGYRGALKRLFDICMTLLILVPALPVMLIIAVVVKLTSRGPAIFRQRRYGLDGEEITVYKFRTMRVQEDGMHLTQATRNDPRITNIGRILRRFSLDELPQLFNVLQGRMSLVGPRPHAVAHNEQYRKLIKGYMVRHKVRPGITGLAQVSGCRGETQDLAAMEARVHFDLEYLRHWSPSLDLKIMLMTARQMMGDNKAY
jgi:putative colanic acid biosynthesis UDP-glucose lipid carrier transferase